MCKTQIFFSGCQGVAELWALEHSNFYANYTICDNLVERTISTFLEQDNVQDINFFSACQRVAELCALELSLFYAHCTIFVPSSQIDLKLGMHAHHINTDCSAQELQLQLVWFLNYSPWLIFLVRGITLSAQVRFTETWYACLPQQYGVQCT